MSDVKRAKTMRNVRSLAYRKRRRGGRRKKWLRRIASSHPRVLTRRLKSCVYFAVDAAANAVSKKTIKLNSAFDPTGDIGGTQPLTFDQYAAIYSRYCVVGWSIKLECVTSDNTVPVMVGITPTTGTSTYTEYQHYKETPGTVSGIMTPDIDKLLLFKRGGVKRWFIPPGGRMLSDDSVTALLTADPSRLLYGDLWCQAMEPSADPSSIRFVVTIWQTIVFFQPHTPARS